MRTHARVCALPWRYGPVRAWALSKLLYRSGTMARMVRTTVHVFCANSQRFKV